MTIELQARPAGTMSTITTPRAVGPLPAGFRFHPTDEELIVHYLRRRAASAPCPAAIIAEVDIYKLDPWDLPSRAAFGQPDGNEWYFFSPRDRKYPNGVRPNRAAGSGYWKATGTDKPITSSSGAGEVVGVKKALVFYQGRPPKGMKTNWIMHEYRLADAAAAAVNAYRPPSRFKASSSMRLDDWVLCRIYKKPNPQLSSLYDRSPSPPSMEAGGSLGHHHHYHQHVEEDSSSPGMLPRAPSISDYLVDYSAVSELFDTMPPPPPETENSATRFFLGNSIGDDEASTARKRQTSAMIDIKDDGGDMSSLRASKRRLSNDASMTTTMNSSTYSMFGPDQQPSSQQDRI